MQDFAYVLVLMYCTGLFICWFTAHGTCRTSFSVETLKSFFKLLILNPSNKTKKIFIINDPVKNKILTKISMNANAPMLNRIPNKRALKESPRECFREKALLKRIGNKKL